MDFITVICCIAAIGYKCCKELKPTRSKPIDTIENDLVFEEAQERIEQLRRTAHRLSQLEELITSLEIASPEEKEQPIQMLWSASDGDTSAYEFWADGRNNTQMLIGVAYSERRKLRSSLLRQITELYSTVVTESVTERKLMPEGKWYA